jgi:hypothetical protein
MGKIIKLKRPSSKVETRERRLRRLARQHGYELVSPWCASERHIRGHGDYLLVPHRSGLSLREVEEVLTRRNRRGQV